MVAVRKQQTSQWQPALRLVRDDEPAAVAVEQQFPPLRLAGQWERAEALKSSERRLFPRRETTQTVNGRRLDHSVVARRQPMLSLSLRDVSLGGLSARTETPLAPGERIAVSFPREGLRMGWDAVGRVLRCEPSTQGYRVAVEFESSPNAA